MHSGVLQAALAYALWGVFPIYFKQVASVSAFEIVLHRSVWSLVFLLALLAALRGGAGIGAVVRQPRRLGLFALSALLLSGNWLVYVWAVNNGRIVDASLGYFIAPLINVLLGYFVLHERPRRGQWVAVGVAAAGVLWLTVASGQVPWIALVLAASFGLYGLMRKTASLGALEGLALETLLLAPLVVPVLAWLTWQGRSALAGGDAATVGWLLLAGPLTVLPLLLFAAGARRLSLTTLGVLQYIGPTIQFALGVWLYREPFDPSRFAGFVLIWAALVIYSAEGWKKMTAPRTLTRPPPEGVRPS